jgi:hypothetical protein
MHSRLRGGIAVLIAVALTLTGCSSSTSGTGRTTGTLSTPGASTPAPTTPAPTTPASSAPASGDPSVTQADANAALLSPTDLGTGFTAAQFSPSSDPLPCTPNDPPLEQRFHSTVEAGTAMVTQAQDVGLSEELRVYADADTAKRVLQAAAHGLDCKQGTLNLTGTPETVTFGKTQDVTSDVGAESAIAVQATSSKYGIVLVGCKLGRLLVLFSFLSDKTADTSKLPNPITIAAKGITKIKNS